MVDSMQCHCLRALTGSIPVAWTFPLLEAFRVLENNLSGAHYMHKQALHAQGALHDARTGLVM